MAFRIKRIIEWTCKNEWTAYNRRVALSKTRMNEREFCKNLRIIDWNKKDTGKPFGVKIVNEIRLFNQIINESVNTLDIEKLRDFQGQEDFYQKMKERIEEMGKLYEEIINLNIELNISKREINLEEDIGLMIKKVLDKTRKKIDMSSLIIKEGNKFTIEKDNEQIKERVYKHYKEWTRKREIDLDLIEYEESWRNLYIPIETIDPSIYDDVISLITIEELEEVLKSVKSNKAPGLSGIPYDFWKHSKELTKNLLLEIINESLERKEVLDEWKKGVIYLINKTVRSDWNQDLNLMRPITLLETARKIYLKILVNRLVKILTEKKILMDTNYAALKNVSTFEPLKIVHGIIEDANKFGKEAWILLMDISKAYDSVSIQILEKSMRRIQLPEKLINIMLDINYNRYNRVLVNNEMTDEFTWKTVLIKEKFGHHCYEEFFMTYC